MLTRSSAYGIPSCEAIKPIRTLQIEAVKADPEPMSDQAHQKERCTRPKKKKKKKKRRTDDGSIEKQHMSEGAKEALGIIVSELLTVVGRTRMAKGPNVKVKSQNARKSRHDPCRAQTVSGMPLKTERQERNSNRGKHGAGLTEAWTNAV
jgi:hypothetical protein